MEYRRGDVRDRSALAEAFRGADVVVHLAFNITGTGPRDDVRAINVDGTLNAFRAAADVGAQRFVYASSVAAYGFHADNPVGMDEDWPTRPAKRLFYAQEKAELESLLADEAAAHPEIGLYLLRPPIVLGPHAVGAKGVLPGPLDDVVGRIAKVVLPLKVPVPALVPAIPLQLIHEDDVGQAFLLCVVGDGPPGAYNIAADDIVTGVDVARALGVGAIPVPPDPAQAAARLVSSVPIPFMQTDWVEAMSHPAIMDTAKAKRELGWAPAWTGIDALRDTLERLTS
jgi:nucleoside-diphosphate-sugar epimerase